MLPHQERVIQERNEIIEKLEKLLTFINSNPAFRELSEDEQKLLQDQSYYMRMYRDVLYTRIGMFT